MRRIIAGALAVAAWLIVGMLGAILWFDYVRPLKSVATEEVAFGQAVRDCFDARNDTAALTSLPEMADKHMVRAVAQVSAVSMMACDRQRLMATRMLAEGVAPAVLEHLELQAVSVEAHEPASPAWIVSFIKDESSEKVDFEGQLRQVIELTALRPLPTKPFEETEKFKLGRALFFDPILSGNRDVACATCHLLSRGSSDGLPKSIGTGADGLGEERRLRPGRLQQPRNALDLWNRDNNAVQSMFWDGRVEVLDPERRIFRSPLGSLLPEGFDNAMAVQAVFPLAQQDEMLGVAGDTSPRSLPGPHAGLPNELAETAAGFQGPRRIEAVARGVVDRVVGAEEPSEVWHETYRSLFARAYPDVAPEQLSIVQIGNALAHFEEIAFATRNTPWDAYLQGDRSALSDQAKQGAVLFYGKARCAACHRGAMFSDFRFYSIGVPDLAASEPDIGRQAVTGDPGDAFKFRTPPLRNVTKTAPYFHDGSVRTLDHAIAQHLDPLYYADKYRESGRFAMELGQIEAVSPILTAARIDLSPEEVGALKAFLGALEDPGQADPSLVIPPSVPSGLPVPVLIGRNEPR